MRICIIGGCGHVGLPLGLAFAAKGADVSLLDIDQSRVDETNEGRIPFVERGAEEVLAEVLKAGRLRATTDQAAQTEADVVIITIGTPLDEFLNPRVMSFERFLDGLLERTRDGQLLVLRSTVFPSLTERLAKRAEEKGLKVDVANCPERIAQGYAMEELTRLPQLVGAVTEQAAKRAEELFNYLGAEVLHLKPTESEMAKLFANAYRYINFAISNQFYMMADRLGADFNAIHAAVTKDYPRLSDFAKPGFAAGPCLLKDTMQLAAFQHNAFALGHAAMMVNEDLPVFIVDKAGREHDLTTKRAAILGMAFKGNNDDHRDSLAFKLRKLLALRCKEVLCTDPYVKWDGFVSLEDALEQADIVFVGAMHKEYQELEIRQPLYDVFDFVKGRSS